MRIDLIGRTALITGASRGVGRSIAEKLSCAGANVALVARGKPALDLAVSEIQSRSDRSVWGFTCDVSSEEDINSTYERIADITGGVDILVNNAGSSSRSGLLGMSRQMLEDDLAVKLHSAVRFAQLAVPRMRAQRWGRIINIISMSAKAPGAASIPTTLSRGAGMVLVKALSKEFAADNILVNALCLGVVKSDQWVREHKERYAHMPLEQYYEMKAKSSDIPLGRIGEANEVASLACFLASDAASYITGTAINVDGGMCPTM